MKHIKLLLILSLIALVPAVLVGCSTVEAQYKIPNAYLTIDINPSVEIITDEEGLVSVVTPLNEDAEVLLIDVNFTGMTVDEATRQIVQLAIEMGYLDFSSENAIIITAEAGEETDGLIKTLQEKVEAFVSKRKMNIEVLKANFEATPDMKALANELGISIGKLKLITVAMANDPELTVAAGAEMSVKDINRIIIDARKEVHDFYKVDFKNQYEQKKNELRFNYLKEKTTLLNDVIQNAEIDAFNDFDLTEDQIIEIKALYQSYLDELLTIDYNTPSYYENSKIDDEEIDDDEIEENEVNPDENANINIEDRIAELNRNRNTLMEQITNEISNMNKNSQMGKEERERIQSRIKEFREELEDLDDQISDVLEDYEDDDENHNFQSKFKDHKRIYKPYNPIKTLNHKYEELFDEYDIELEDLEEEFEDLISEALDILHEENKLSLENYKDAFKEQSEIVKQQLKDEKQALKEIWRKDK